MSPKLILAACLLPLFPFSLIFNAVFAWIRPPLARAALLLGWPLSGLWVLAASGITPPDWIVPWALATALLYALRALTLRDAGQWLAYLSVSLGALLWVQPEPELAWAMSAPLALLALVLGAIVKRYGAAFAGYPDALAARSPRLAGVFALAVLAAIGTPPFSSFFVWLSWALTVTPGAAVVLLVVWLLWSWAAIRLLQGLLVGEAPPEAARPVDLGRAGVWLAALALVALLAGGLWIAGGRI